MEQPKLSAQEMRQVEDNLIKTRTKKIHALPFQGENGWIITETVSLLHQVDLLNIRVNNFSDRYTVLKEIDTVRAKIAHLNEQIRLTNQALSPKDKSQ